MIKINAITFWICFFIILFVAAIDEYLLVKYPVSIKQLEKNMLGQYLINRDDGDVALLAATKLFGTVFGLTIIRLVYLSNPKWGLTICSTIALLATFLLHFLFSG